MKLNIYLNYGGNCREAFQFYEQHLGAKITRMHFFSEMPPGPGSETLPEEWKKKAVMHARITLAGTELMGSDVPPQRFQPMRSVYLTLAASSTDEAERIYALLTNDGEVFMPMQETFFAHRFAMLRDKFGTSRMILHERPMPQT